MTSESAWATSSKMLLALVLLTSPLQGGLVGSRIPAARLAETGLYADFAKKTVAAENRLYSPQYPLWSDGAKKRRWIYLPPGTTIEASRADQWIFPVGTKLWKEFSFGRRVETRLLEKVDTGEWVYATYAWNADESDAVLVSERGLRTEVEVAPGKYHDIPGGNDCRACHEGAGRDAVLGFNALQLSPDRDPGAPNAEPIEPGMIDLRSLVDQGRLENLPSRFIKSPPRINASTPQGRAALGYLWANCGGCHNASDPLASVGMVLRVPLEGDSGGGLPELPTVIGQASKFQIPGLEAGRSYRIWPGDPSRSTLLYRMGSRSPLRQMPPLASKIVDQEALDLITRWIQEDLGSYAEEHR